MPLNAQNTNTLVGTSAKKFRNENKNLKFLIIDEMSMIGANRLWQLNCRLRELQPDKDEPFGGIFIYFFGDFRQLPPVKDTPLYYQLASTLNGNKGLKLFQTIKHRFELKCTYRQANDKQFADLVDRIGLGTITQSDYQTLAKRDFNLLSNAECDSFDKAVYLCSKNINVNRANELHLEQLGNPIAKIVSENILNCKLKNNEEETGGLHHVIYISVGCRVMLTRNLWTKAGLVNGALGTVMAIIYDEDIHPPDLPLYILVKFDKYYGRTFHNDCVPIIVEHANWIHDNINYFRRQIPLVLSYSISIHKGQGLTIPKVIIDIGDSEFSIGITYVALTRTRQLSDIIFKPFFPYDYYP